MFRDRNPDSHGATAGLLRNVSLSRKLILIIMAISLTAVLLACTAFIAHEIHELRQRMVRGIMTHGQMLADNCEAALAFDDPKDAEDVLRSLRAEKSIAYAEIRRENGKLLASYRRQDFAGDMIDLGAGGPQYRFSGNWLVMMHPIILNERQIGTIYIQSDLGEMTAFLRQSLAVLALIMAASSLVAFFLSSRLQRVISAPVFHLADVARAVSQQEDYSLRATKGGEDELGLLVDSFNEMLSQIERRDEALRQSEERYSGLLKRLNEAVYRMSLPDGRYEYFSPAVKSVFGYDAQVFLDNPTFAREAVAPESREYFQAEWAKLLQGEVEPTYEYKIRDAEGRERWIFQSNTGVFDEDGRIIAIEGCCTDVTERRQAEEELKRLRSFLRNIIDSMPSVLVGVDPEGRVTHWNREAWHATGVTPDQAQGHSLEDVYPDLIAQMENVRRAIREGRPQRVERLTRLEEGEARFCDVTVYPLTINGMKGAVIRVDDVTSRVRIEEMMIQSEKMLSVGGLAAGMAHEVNNPLAGILQSVQLILKRLTVSRESDETIARSCGTSVSAVQEYLRRRNIMELLEGVRDSGSRAARIVDNMLSFSRKGESDFAPHDIAALLDSTVELAANDYDLKKKYDFRRIKIVREYDPNLPFVYCEQTKIQQVILNLLKNAAHAMVEGPDPVAAPMITLRTEHRGKWARIEVEDNGPGMSEAVRKRVFEPFFTTKNVGVGTGLGLSVSYFIITDNHGGSMHVESAPGRGTKFTISLLIDKPGE